MMLFFADHPDYLPEQDGMAQRIAAIDRCFATCRRSYLKVSLLRHLRGTREQRPDLQLSIYRLNLFLHLPEILRLLLHSSVLYLHSAGNALALLPAILLRPAITDLHGLVSDELLMAGNYPAFARYRLVERVLFRYSVALVVVSEKMMQLVRSRYRLADKQYFVVPVFDDSEYLPHADVLQPEEKPLLIYAGGAQAWQNVDLMLDAFKQVSDRYRLRILTADQDCFLQKLKARGLASQVELLTVQKRDIYRHYAEARFGFVLRDDVEVNRVACPTKLVEYLAAGLVPIVLQPDIGDFKHYGYGVVTLQQLLHGVLPDQAELDQLRETNRAVAQRMRRDALTAVARLTAFCERLQHG